MKKRSLKYKEAKKKIGKEGFMSIDKALEKVSKASYSKFDGSIELKINLNIDPKDSEQNVRFTTELPYPTGRKRKVLVFSSDKIEAKKYKTIEVIEANEKSIQKVQDGSLAPKKDFDVVVADSKLMPKIAIIAKVLGPKGLMPSPKTGTVGDVLEILKSLDKGQIEIRSQHNNKVVHLVLGNIKTKQEYLVENFNKIMEEIKKNKPAKVKKSFVQSIYISASMSPSIKVEIE